jgi:hypothetical protein
MTSAEYHAWNYAHRNDHLSQPERESLCVAYVLRDGGDFVTGCSNWQLDALSVQRAAARIAASKKHGKGV